MLSNMLAICYAIYVAAYDSVKNNLNSLFLFFVRNNQDF